MAEKILLIQPRWMTEAMTRQKIEFWREKYPRAVFTLLSQSPIENVATDLILPPLEPQKIAQFARKLRHTRFRRAIILTDAGHGDVGYGEAKFWAFAANARRREFDEKSLTIWREAKAKKKVIQVFLAGVAIWPARLFKKPRRAASLAAPELINSARTFVYLQHAAHQHGAKAERVALIGDSWDEDTALRCGWQIAAEKSNATLLLCDTSVARKTPTFHNYLVCFSGVSGEFSCAENQREVESRAAFFDNQSRDIWLVTKR